MAPRPGERCLEAVYTCPTATKTFRHPVTSAVVDVDTDTYVKSKTEYLADLRSSTKLLQEQINTFLTQKMEEDKNLGGIKAASSAQHIKTGDEVEEENYGEENADDGS